ncbi:MAG: tRNA pseudouridine(55) synthase TruB [Gemmatimonadota bacterium]
MRPSGVLLVDKSAGPTSHDVVAAARRALHTRRVGHTGTLDPFATGLLLLCVERATRLVEYFHAPAKEYRAVVRLGVETSTHDREGEIVRVSEAWRRLERERLLDVVSGFQGELQQLPPAYSAKRVGGRRAHRVARGGGVPALAPVRVRIHELRALEFEPPVLHLEASVSAGTYLRALVRDLGRELGCGAHLTDLRRTRIGPFRVEEALPDAALGALDLRALTDRSWWCSPAEALGWLPRRRLEEAEERLVREGRRISAGTVDPPPGVDQESSERTAGDPPVALVRGDRLVGVAVRDGAELQPRKVLSGG